MNLHIPFENLGTIMPEIILKQEGEKVCE